MVLNTGSVAVNECGQIIADFTNTHITPTKEAEGNKLVEEMLKAQSVVNKLIFDYKIKIDFLHAAIEDGVFVLYGVTDAPALVEQALEIVCQELPQYQTRSALGTPGCGGWFWPTPVLSGSQPVTMVTWIG